MFWEVSEEAQDSARVMAIVLHPLDHGRPDRLMYFRKLIEHISGPGKAHFWMGEQILDSSAGVWGRPDLALGRCQMPR